MSPRYILSEDAEEDLDSIASYIAEQASPTTARRMLARFRETFQLLAEHPSGED